MNSLDIHKNDLEKYAYWTKVAEETNYPSLHRQINRVLKDQDLLFSRYGSIRIMRNSKVVKKSLEVGCGSGAHSFLSKKLRFVGTVYLCDITFQALKNAKKLFDDFGENYHLVLCDAKNLPFKDKSFDLIYSGGLLEHFDSNEQEAITREQCRVAEDNICEVPLRSFGYTLLRFIVTLKNRGWPFGKESPMSLSQLKQIFSKNKYRIIRFTCDNFLISLIVIYNLPLWIRRFLPKTVFNLFKHEITVYAKKV